MDQSVLAALVTGPTVIVLDRAVSWLRGRRKDDAEAQLTVGQAWQSIAEELRNDISNLRSRVERLEGENGILRDRLAAALAEVDHYKRIAKSFARHVLRLRESLANSEAEVPVLPTDVEDALTIIELP